MKKWLAMIGISILALVGLVACGSGSGGTTDDENFKIGLVMSGSISDGGWNQTAYNGLMAAGESLEAETLYSENTQASDYEKIMRDYAKEGCNIIIGHGFQYEDAIQTVASEYPDISFIITSSEISNGENLASIQNNYFQCGFLQGAFAALMSESGNVGAVGGKEIPPITNAIKGFVAGAEYTKPGIIVKTATTGDTEDAGKVKEQSLTFLSQGADVIMVNADHAGRGGYEAAAEKNAWAIASIAAEFDAYPDSLIACGEADMATAIEQVCTSVKDDTFEAKNYLMGVPQDIVRLSYSPELEDQIPQDVKDKIESLKKEIIDGSLVVEDYIK